MAVLVAVVDTGNFTAAARAFDMSPVMVGKHIASLESILGTRLLVRTTRRQRLTEIGAQYVEQCRTILEQIAAAESGAEAMHGAPRGRLKITAPLVFGAEQLAPALTGYLRQQSDVSLDLHLNDRAVDLVDEGYDAAIRIGKLHDSSMVGRPLRDYAMLICASPAYLAARGTPRTPADLAGHECLDSTLWQLGTRSRLQQGAAGKAPAGRFRANNGQALRMAALEDFGIVMQAEALLANDVATGRLVPVLAGYLPPPRPMHLVYPRDRQATPKLTTFVDFVMERFGPTA